MKFFSGKAAEPALAVDLGSSSVKVARLGEGGKVVSCDLAPLPQVTSEDIKSRSRQDGLVVDALKALVQRLGVNRIETVSMLSGRSVYIRRLKMIQMSKVELDKAIRFEAKTTLPFPIAEAVIDYLVLKRFEETGVKKQEVLVFAVPKKALEEHLGILRRAGLEPVAIDISPFAYLRYFDKNYPDLAGRTFAYIDLGAEKTEVDIYREGHVIFSRTIAFGGRQLTQAISEELNISWAEAEELKKEYGHPLKLEKEVLARSAKGDKAWAAHEAAAHLYVQLLTDLRRSLEYFSSQFPEAALEKIFIGGGLAGCSGLDQFIGQNLGLVVAKATAGEVPLAPTTRTAAAGIKDPTSLFIGCLGLASWSGSAIRINLAGKKVGLVAKGQEKIAKPASPKEIQALRQAVYGVLGLIAVLGVIVLGWGLWLGHQIRQQEAILNDKKTQLTQLQAAKKKLEEARLGRAGRLAEYEALFNALQSRSRLVSEIMDDVALFLPEEVAITNFQINSKDKKMDISASASSRKKIEDFLGRIESYPLVDSFQLMFIRSGTAPGDPLNQSFQINAVLR